MKLLVDDLDGWSDEVIEAAADRIRTGHERLYSGENLTALILKACRLEGKERKQEFDRESAGAVLGRTHWDDPILAQRFPEVPDDIQELMIKYPPPEREAKVEEYLDGLEEIDPEGLEGPGVSS